MIASRTIDIGTKLAWNLPWLVRHPFGRLKSLLERTAFEKKHVIITIANHFEPAWSASGNLDLKTQVHRLTEYRKLAATIGDAVRDADGTKFRHTNFYPAEQYDPAILDILAEMQSEGLGEVEVHLHHGVERPDTADNLRAVLVDFRDTLAERHRCLARMDGVGDPMYAFVHGNLALANSCGGAFCGVDNEMEILRETGCYVDMTMPSAPDRTQVPMTNCIYEYAGDPTRPVPHGSGDRARVSGNRPRLPLIFTGPLVFKLKRRGGIPVIPSLDDGALSAAQGSSLARLKRWKSANISVAGRSDWLFVKLYCHGFFDHDQSAAIGEDAKRFFGDIVESAPKSETMIHFATAREATNMVFAAIDGKEGDPHLYRDYRLRSIMGQND